MVKGPPRGYFPEPTKSILVMSPRNFPLAEAFFQGYVLHVVTGSRYLGGFVGTEAAHDQWLEEGMEGWRALVAIMAEVAVNFPQAAYMSLQKSLQK